MKKVSLMIHDAPVRTRTRDSILSAVDPGKCIVLGTVWQGELKPFIDDYLESLTALVTPFSAGHILHAELTPEVLNMGKVWAGELRGKIRDAVITSTSGVNPEPHPGYVNAEELVAEAEKLHQIMQSPLRTSMRPSFPISDVQATLRRLRRASDAITRTFPSPTRDARPAGVMGYSKPIGSGSKPVTPAMVMEAASKFWAGRCGTTAPTLDAPSAKAMTPVAINRMNAAFWAARAR